MALGGLGGWKGTVQIPEGGDISFRQVLHAVSPLAWAPKGADDILHVNSFEVKYRSDGSEEQFLSDLSVYRADGGEQLAHKEIKVNTPLRHKVCAAVMLGSHLEGCALLLGNFKRALEVKAMW